jgi:20S proteasome alpha/beta subunit
MTVGKTMVSVKEALNAVYRAQIELHETGEFADKTLDEAFKHLTGSKVKLERWIKENNDD